MLLHLTCAFGVITFSNETVIALFHHFFLQIQHIEIDQTAHKTTASRPPVPCILQILTTFNLYSGRPGVGLSVNNKQKVRQAMVRFQQGVATTPLGQICLKWLDHRRVKMGIPHFYLGYMSTFCICRFPISINALFLPPSDCDKAQRIQCLSS